MTLGRQSGGLHRVSERVSSPRGQVQHPSKCSVWFSVLTSQTKRKRSTGLKHHLLIFFPSVFSLEVFLTYSKVQNICTAISSRRAKMVAAQVPAVRPEPALRPGGEPWLPSPQARRDHSQADSTGNTQPSLQIHFWVTPSLKQACLSMVKGFLTETGSVVQVVLLLNFPQEKPHCPQRPKPQCLGVLLV